MTHTHSYVSKVAGGNISFGLVFLYPYK